MLIAGTPRRHPAADAGWSDSLTMAALAGAIVFITAFVLIEVRARQPLMPLWILKDRVRGASYGMMLLLNASLFGAFFFLTEFFQDVLKYSPLLAGLAFLPASIGFVAGAAIVPRLVDRLSVRLLAIAGTLTAAAGLTWLTQPGPGSSYVTGVLGPIILMSVGTGLTLVVLTITATEGISIREL
jgi:predicted MFS family arabinose efflux permease